MGEEIKTRTDYSSEECCCKGEKKNKVAAGERCAIKEGIIFFPPQKMLQLMFNS